MLLARDHNLPGFHVLHHADNIERAVWMERCRAMSALQSSIGLIAKSALHLGGFAHRLWMLDETQAEAMRQRGHIAEFFPLR